MYSLSGKRALIGGGSQGLGRACAVALAQAGAHVVVYARSEAKLRTLVAELPQPKLHQYIVADVGNRAELCAAVNTLHAQDPFSIVINNTHGPNPGSLAEATEASFIEAFAHHVLLNHALLQLVLPSMKVQKFGRIINILSTSVKTPLPQLGVSNTIRAAVASWAKTLATELGPFGITVNNVLPSTIETPRMEALLEDTAQRQGISAEAALQSWIRSIPAGRFGLPEEVAEAVRFLVSPLAGYINGINLSVDGGRTPSL